jgi:peptide/nickel transport system permease protein
MKYNYSFLVRRIGIFILTVLVAVTLNFAITRLTPQDPIAALLGRMASRGRSVERGEQIVAMYRERFGLDDPLIVQYFSYVKNLFQGDMGYSLSYFPAKVEDVIFSAVPWTLGLSLVTIFLSFTIGNLLGGIAAWPKTPKFIKNMVFIFMPFSSIPYYLLAMILIYLLAIENPIFPIGSSFTVGSVRGFNLKTIADLLYHAALPIFSMLLGVVGFWALSMRGIMTTTFGEDYLVYAKAKGLRNRRIFFGYAMRNALLPQVTALAIDLGGMISGQVIVEIIFNYPGIGWVLYNALGSADYFVIQGVVLFLIISIALATLLVDLLYPLLDPRIQYEG